MRRVAPVLVLGVAVLAGCSGAAAPAPTPGIAARSDVVVEERSTCEALARVDLGLVDQDAASFERSHRAMEQVVERAPAGLLGAARSLASTYAGLAASPDQADEMLLRANDRDVVLRWFNQRCGGSR